MFFNYKISIIHLSCILLTGFSCFGQKGVKYSISFVNCMIGTGRDANLLPVASVPFGIVQIGADTHLNNSGYKYSSSEIIGFSHTHLSGGGCTDFKDIIPMSYPLWIERTTYPDKVSSRFTHNKEQFESRYYKVKLLDSNINVELSSPRF